LGSQLDTVAAVNQFIEIGGKRRARKDSAVAGLKGAEARLADARRLLDQGVTEAYVGVLLAESNRGVLADSAAALRQEARMRKRGNALATFRAPTNQIEIAAERLELDAAGAESQAHKARVALEVLLGEKEPRGEIEPADTLDSLGNVSAEATNAPPLFPSDLDAADAARVKAERICVCRRRRAFPILRSWRNTNTSRPINRTPPVSAFPFRCRCGIAMAATSLPPARARTNHRQGREDSRSSHGDIAVARISYAEALTRWRRYRENLRRNPGRFARLSPSPTERRRALLDLLSAQRSDNEVRLATAQAAADAANAAANLRAALNLADPTNPQTK